MAILGEMLFVALTTTAGAAVGGAIGGVAGAVAGGPVGTLLGIAVLNFVKRSR